MKKLTKLQFAQLLPFLVGIVLSLLSLALSPVFPEYNLWRAGVLGLTLLFVFGLMIIYIEWVERLKEQEKDSDKEEK